MPLNVGRELYIYERDGIFFCVQFQTQTCFETAQIAVWMPKLLFIQNFFSLPTQLKLR